MNDSTKNRQALTRRERNRLRRRRSRIITLSLLGCGLLFLTGVMITYNVMIGVMGLPEENSIFSFGNTGQALKDLADEVSTHPMREVTGNIRLFARKIIERIHEIISTIPAPKLPFHFPLDWQIRNKV
jgi:hypothetical protein